MKKGHRQKNSGRSRRTHRAALTAFCVALVAIMLGLGGYIAHWYLNLGRIRAEGKRYASLYGGRESAANETQTSVPTTVPTAVPTIAPTAEPTPIPTEEPTATPTKAPTPAPTDTPSPAPVALPGADMPVVEDVPIPAETKAPVTADTPTPGADMPVVEDVPIPTPGSDTLVIALPTAPPVQASFDALLKLNPETVGFLEIEEMLSLPVVQRENDNDFYLNHTFEGAPAQEGALFLDGMNRLVPEDDCLIVYGHNMKNKTMFGRLSAYGDIDYLRRHPVVRFDTLYENRSYVAFAAFTASMEQGNSRYFDVRNFIFDEVEFDKFVLKLQSRSRFDIPVDVTYGDHLLLLVTCDYTNREGRFILALRQLREDETEGDVWAEVMGTVSK